jgi:hypothetical protein
MIIKRRYYDILENEEWLNEMAQDGHAMDDFCPGLFCDTFSFDKCEPGEYTFRILMLDNNDKHPKSLRYLRFLRENGVEHIKSNGHAVYLRKKTADGPFDLFTDRDSQLTYHKKMIRMYAYTLLLYPTVLALGVGAMLLSRLLNISQEWWYLGAGVTGGLLIGLLITSHIVVKCVQALRHYRKAVKRLKNEGLLYE